MRRRSWGGEPLNDVSTFSQRGPLLKIERLIKQICVSISGSLCLSSSGPRYRVIHKKLSHKTEDKMQEKMKRSEQCGSSERVSGASNRANRRACSQPP